VFGKPADFDAQTDPLVRVEALRLRQRLLEYYAGDGGADAVRIELPRGGYVVSACYTKPAAEERAATRAYPIGSWARRAAVGAAAAIVAIASIVLLRPQPLAEQRGPTELSHKTQIVVAPIENLRTNDGLQRLAASLTEEIMLRLDGLDLFVVATQAQWYGAPSGLDDVLGKEHTYVLTGSVREHGKGLRISVRSRLQPARHFGAPPTTSRTRSSSSPNFRTRWPETSRPRRRRSVPCSTPSSRSRAARRRSSCPIARRVVVHFGARPIRSCFPTRPLAFIISSSADPILRMRGQASR
jgi:hypothetical protein